MTPYSSVSPPIVVADDTQFVAVPCVGRGLITQIAAVLESGGAFTANFFNRAFTNTAQTCRLCDNDGNGFCRFKMPLPFAVKVGDIVVGSGSAQVAYNVSHRVTDVYPDDKTFVTNVAFVDNRSDVVLQLNIPSNEQALYDAYPQVGGTGYGVVVQEVPYINQDPQTNLTNRGFPQWIYVKFSAAGTYRISITAKLGVAQGD